MSDRCATEASLLQILDEARRGDEQSLEELLKRLLPTVRAWCVGRLRDPRLHALVDDIVQETAIRIVRHLGSCRASSSRELAAWTLSIAQREALRAIEHGWIRYWVSLEGAGVLGDQGDDADSKGLVSGPLATLLSEAYSGLPEGTQRLLYLRIIEGWSWKEVGAEFDTTAGGAKRRCQRALARLKAYVLTGRGGTDSRVESLLEKLKDQI